MTTDFHHDETMIDCHLAATTHIDDVRLLQHAFATIEYQEAETAIGADRDHLRRLPEEKTFLETISSGESR